jgi:hypothetical protein
MQEKIKNVWEAGERHLRDIWEAAKRMLEATEKIRETSKGAREVIK